MPPMPSARSSDNAPVGIASTLTRAPSSPMRMIVPSPNWRSIWVSAPCRAASRTWAAFASTVICIAFSGAERGHRAVLVSDGIGAVARVTPPDRDRAERRQLRGPVRSGQARERLVAGNRADSGTERSVRSCWPNAARAARGDHRGCCAPRRTRAIVVVRSRTGSHAGAARSAPRPRGAASCPTPGRRSATCGRRGASQSVPVVRSRTGASDAGSRPPAAPGPRRRAARRGVRRQVERRRRDHASAPRAAAAHAVGSASRDRGRLEATTAPSPARGGPHPQVAEPQQDAAQQVQRDGRGPVAHVGAGRRGVDLAVDAGSRRARRPRSRPARPASRRSPVAARAHAGDPRPRGRPRDRSIAPIGEGTRLDGDGALVDQARSRSENSVSRVAIAADEAEPRRREAASLPRLRSASRPRSLRGAWRPAGRDLQSSSTAMAHGVADAAAQCRSDLRLRVSP